MWQRIDISDNAAQQQLTFSSQTELSLVILTRTKHMEDEPAVRAEQGRLGLHALSRVTRFDLLEDFM